MKADKQERIKLMTVAMVEETQGLPAPRYSVLMSNGTLLTEQTLRQVGQLIGQSGLPSTMKADPVGLKEIAHRLGMKQQTASVWRHRGILPPPRWTVSGSPAWEWADIEKWHSNRSGKGIARALSDA